MSEAETIMQNTAIVRVRRSICRLTYRWILYVAGKAHADIVSVAAAAAVVTTVADGGGSGDDDGDKHFISTVATA